MKLFVFVMRVHLRLHGMPWAASAKFKTPRTKAELQRMIDAEADRLEGRA